MRTITTLILSLTLVFSYAQKVEIVEKGGKYGLKTDFGKELLPIEYISITECLTDSVDYYLAERSDISELYSYNTDRRSLFDETSDQEFTILKWMKDAGDIDKNFYGFDKKGNKFQLIGMDWVQQKVKKPIPCKNTNGKFAICEGGENLTDYIYSEIRKSNKILEVKTDSGWIAMNKKIEPMYKWSYDKIYQSSVHPGVFVVQKGDKHGIFSESGDFMVPICNIKFVRRTLDLKGSMAKANLEKNYAVKRGSKWGIISHENDIEVPFKYDNAYMIDPFSVEKYDLKCIAVVKDGDKWKFLNEKYEEHKTVDFEKWIGVHGEFAFVIIDGKVQQMSLKTFDTQSNLYFGEYDDYIKVISEDDKVGVIGKEGEIIMPFDFDWVIIEDAEDIAFIVAVKDGKDGIYSLDGVQIVPHDYKHLIILYQMFEKQFFSVGFEGHAALASWSAGTKTIEVLTERKYKNINYSTAKELFYGELSTGEKVWFDETGKIIE